MKIKEWIPNMLTLGNLVCGCIAIKYAALYEFQLVALFVLAGAVLDFFDGFVARLLKVSSDLGKQLDSLADVVTFGVAPGFAVYHYLLYLSQWTGTKVSPFIPDYVYPHGDHFLAVPAWAGIIGLLIPVFSAIRLAVFNLDKSQSDSFKGLPTPANGLFFVFFCSFLFNQFGGESGCDFSTLDSFLPGWVKDIFSNGWLLFSLVVLFSMLMVSRIPLFALKFKSFGFKGNEIRYVFLTLALGMLIIFQLRAIPLIVLLYLLLSLIAIPFNRKNTHEI